ncbi:MAG: 4'-phosphopantetheinyl transferase superfamily protein [Gammaproteobacteria bacterium]|nr:MAG: 4'-phosphopantetheinyl transferase superfamily protein [Gammaproteobacteria bacterium]
MNTFIFEAQSTSWFKTDLPTYHCRFDKSLYKDELFAQLGIYFPESLINAVAKRRAEFLAGRYCAAEALRQLNIHNFIIKTGANRNPLWPETVKGSISHCDNYAIAIASDKSDLIGVGIDIESQITEETFEKIQSQVLSVSEIELISNIDLKKTISFAVAFSLKESFFKASYPTIQKYFDFSAVTITDIDSVGNTVSFKVNETLHESFKKGMLLQGEFHLLPEEKVVTLVKI